jgi:hypothetical protein
MKVLIIKRSDNDLAYSYENTIRVRIEPVEDCVTVSADEGDCHTVSGDRKTVGDCVTVSNVICFVLEFDNGTKSFPLNDYVCLVGKDFK